MDEAIEIIKGLMTTISTKNKHLNDSLKLNLLNQMMRIRFVEEEIARRYSEQKMRCPTHLSIGQEAVPAAISQCVNKDDFAVSTHRGHAHYLAKGGNLKSMISEIYGKATGCSKGKGGSMHLIDKSVGFMGTSAIVGNSIPIGVGLALSAELKKTNQISIVFLGDGAVEEGVFYESVNFSVVRNLPVLFLCENNLYSVYSPLSVRQPKGREIYEMVSGIGAKVAIGDGNDAVKAFDLINSTISKIRSGEGPFFLEFKTYRFREHCGHNYDNDLGYRSLEEFESWKERDPIKLLKDSMLKFKVVNINKFEEISETIKDEVFEAFKFAEDSPFPKRNEAFTNIYAKIKG